MKSLVVSASIAGGLLAAATVPYTVSGPYTHDNLSIFLIHATPPSSGKQYVALEKAMKEKGVIVYETNNVNSLAIENVSSNPVFIQGGDIVKGGQQDRVISNDFVLPPKSGRLPVSAFCVEQGRWSRRGSESAGSFSVSNMVLPSKALKQAAIVDQDQQKVWQEVTKEQMGLASGSGRSDRTDGTHLGVGSGAIAAGSADTMLASPSSLQLTLESRPVRDAAEPYIAKLNRIVNGQKDVVGFAYLINGELESADVYADQSLFSALWPKLLRSSAIEAARLHKNAQSRPAKSNDIETMLGIDTSLNEAASTIELRNNVKLIRRETPVQIVIESREGDTWIHRSYLKK